MYYPDLSPYSYLDRPEPDTYTIGWLDASHRYPKGETSAELRRRLLSLCAFPVNRTRGWHQCPFCDGEYPITINVFGKEIALGDGEIRVEGANGRKYAAPNLICHYIEKHRYRPPDEFQRAVLDSP